LGHIFPTLPIKTDYLPLNMKKQNNRLASFQLGAFYLALGIVIYGFIIAFEWITKLF
jgi:hypothetical protein